MTAEPDHPDNQGDHPRERADPGPDATEQAEGADPATPLAGTPTIPRSKTLPAALPSTIPASLPEDTEDEPPSCTIRTA